MTNPNQMREVLLFVCSKIADETSSKIADETNLSSKRPVAARSRKD